MGKNMFVKELKNWKQTSFWHNQNMTGVALQFSQELSADGGNVTLRKTVEILPDKSPAVEGREEEEEGKGQKSKEPENKWMQS